LYYCRGEVLSRTRKRRILNNNNISRVILDVQKKERQRDSKTFFLSNKRHREKQPQLEVDTSLTQRSKQERRLKLFLTKNMKKGHPSVTNGKNYENSIHATGFSVQMKKQASSSTSFSLLL
jgi:hypothetical protein